MAASKSQGVANMSTVSLATSDALEQIKGGPPDNVHNNVPPIGRDDVASHDSTLDIEHFNIGVTPEASSKDSAPRTLAAVEAAVLALEQAVEAATSRKRRLQVFWRNGWAKYSFTI